MSTLNYQGGLGPAAGRFSYSNHSTIYIYSAEYVGFSLLLYLRYIINTNINSLTNFLTISMSQELMH